MGQGLPLTYIAGLLHGIVSGLAVSSKSMASDYSSLLTYVYLTNLDPENMQVSFVAMLLIEVL